MMSLNYIYFFNLINFLNKLICYYLSDVKIRGIKADVNIKIMARKTNAQAKI